MAEVDKIGLLKKAHNVSVIQAERWTEVLKEMHLKSSGKGLSEEFIKALFKVIHQESIDHQEKIFKN